MTPAPIGIFGGTFNPVHHGHLRSALELCERLALQELRLMPAAVPPHRAAPDCPAEQRAALVELAIEGEGRLRCDRRELQRAGPSYTVDSLEELRAELGAQVPLCLVTGADAVSALAGWHRWRDLLQFAHIVVIARPGWTLPEAGEVAGFLEDHRVDTPERLHDTPAGRVLVLHTTPLAISSTEIRALIGAGRSPRYLLPDSVWRYIQDNALYGYRETTAE